MIPMLISNKMHVILVYLNEFIHMESFIKLFNCGPQGYGVRASLCLPYLAVFIMFP